MTRTLAAVTWLLPFTLLHTGLGIEAAAQAATPRDERVLQDALVAGIAIGIPGLSVAIGVGDSVVWAGTARVIAT